MSSHENLTERESAASRPSSSFRHQLGDRFGHHHFSAIRPRLAEKVGCSVGLEDLSPLRIPRSSFLFIRIQQNSAFYASIAQEGREQQPNRTWEEWLEHYVEVSANRPSICPLTVRRRPWRT
jgi:hypothetical protein